jgi:hypothetical protein
LSTVTVSAELRQRSCNYEIDNFFQLTNIVNWTKGRHNVRADSNSGPQQNLIDYANVAGSWVSSGMTNIGSGTRRPFWELPTRRPDSAWHRAPRISELGEHGAGCHPYQYRWKYYAGFLQDDFSHSRLTLNIGIRYQVEVPHSEKTTTRVTSCPRR